MSTFNHRFDRLVRGTSWTALVIIGLTLALAVTVGLCSSFRGKASQLEEQTLQLEEQVLDVTQSYERDKDRIEILESNLCLRLASDAVEGDFPYGEANAKFLVQEVYYQECVQHQPFGELGYRLPTEDFAELLGW